MGPSLLSPYSQLQNPTPSSYILRVSLVSVKMSEPKVCPSPKGSAPAGGVLLPVRMLV